VSPGSIDEALTRGNDVSNVAAIFRRELAGFFGHPLAYIVLTLHLGLLTAFSLGFDDVLASGVASMRGPFFWIAACFLFLIPAVSMRLLAEERRSGSLEMLGTLPLTSLEVVVGKWLAAVALLTAALLLTFSWPIALAHHGDLDWGPVLGGYLGLLLQGAAFAAIGTFASAVTENQVIAFLLSLTACLLPWALGFFLPLVPGDWLPLVQYLTFEYHFTNLARGVVDSRSIVFYGSVVVVGLRLAVLVLENRRLS
jgi:ABC-2 type transport system permease protein